MPRPHSCARKTRSPCISTQPEAGAAIRHQGGISIDEEHGREPVKPTQDGQETGKLPAVQPPRFIWLGPREVLYFLFHKGAGICAQQSRRQGGTAAGAVDESESLQYSAPDTGFERRVR